MILTNIWDPKDQTKICQTLLKQDLRLWKRHIDLDTVTQKDIQWIKNNCNAKKAKKAIAHIVKYRLDEMPNAIDNIGNHMNHEYNISFNDYALHYEIGQKEPTVITAPDGHTLTQKEHNKFLKQWGTSIAFP